MPRRRPRRRHHPEARLQRAVFRCVRTRGAPGAFIFHPVNGGYRKPVGPAILKQLSAVAGVPDLIAIHEGRCFAMALKIEGRDATAKQLACIEALNEAGAFTAIPDGLDRALACLEAWGLLQGHAS